MPEVDITTVLALIAVLVSVGTLAFRIGVRSNTRGVENCAKAAKNGLTRLEKHTEDQERRIRGIEIGRAGCLVRLKAMEEKMTSFARKLDENAEKLDEVLRQVKKLNGS